MNPTDDQKQTNNLNTILSQPSNNVGSNNAPLDYNDPNNNPFLKNLDIPKYDELLKNIQNDMDTDDSSNSYNFNQFGSIANSNSSMFGMPTNNSITHASDPRNSLNVLTNTIAQNQSKPQMPQSFGNPENKANFGGSVAVKENQEVANIVERLRSIDAINEKDDVKSPPPKDIKEQEEKRLFEEQKKINTTTSQYGEIKVYGYKIPQKAIAAVIKMSKVHLNDSTTAKTWLFVLTGKILALKDKKLRI